MGTNNPWSKSMIHTHTHMRTHNCTCTHAHAPAHMHARRNKCTSMHAHTHTPAHTQTRARTHPYTYAHGHTDSGTLPSEQPCPVLLLVQFGGWCPRTVFQGIFASAIHRGRHTCYYTCVLYTATYYAIICCYVVRHPVILWLSTHSDFRQSVPLVRIYTSYHIYTYVYIYIYIHT